MSGKHDCDSITAYRCASCDELFDEADVDLDDRAYECIECGPFLRSDSNNYNHQCPECNKFGSRINDHTGIPCPECGADGELMELQEALMCNKCNKIFAEEPDEDCEADDD